MHIPTKLVDELLVQCLHLFGWRSTIYNNKNRIHTHTHSKFVCVCAENNGIAVETTATAANKLRVETSPISLSD